MRVLNLYAGVGGNRKLWGDVEVTAVELDPRIASVYQRLFPSDKVVIGDAHQYLLDHCGEFDFIWSSPPCQSHSRMNKGTRHKLRRYPDLSLYQEILFLKSFFKGKWVVENVVPYYEPLIPAQRVDRHLFWSSFPVDPFEMSKPANFINLCTLAGKEALMEWLDIYYPENIYYDGNHCPAQVLRNCVHPQLGLHVLQCAFRPDPQLLLNAYSQPLS